MCNRMEALLQRAEADLRTACREHAVTEGANPASVCHHAQSAALHFLQARLMLAGQPYPSTPHPVVLLECCLELEPEWEGHRNDLRLIHLLAMDAQDPMVRDLDEMAEGSLNAAMRFAEAARPVFTGAAATAP